jgi:hypothetical protein
VIQKSELPKDLAERVYGLNTFKPMDQKKKYGLDKGVTKEELEEKIWDIGFRDYDTAMRRERAATQKSKLLKSKEESQRSLHSEKAAETEEEREIRLAKEKEQRDEQERILKETIAAKKEEQARRKMVDMYKIDLTVLNTDAYGTTAWPADLELYVERVVEPQGVEEYQHIYIPWNKLSTRNEVELTFTVKHPKTGEKLVETAKVNIMKHAINFKLSKVCRLEFKAVVDLISPQDLE